MAILHLAEVNQRLWHGQQSRLAAADLVQFAKIAARLLLLRQLQVCCLRLEFHRRSQYEPPVARAASRSRVFASVRNFALEFGASVKR